MRIFPLKLNLAVVLMTFCLAGCDSMTPVEQINAARESMSEGELRRAAILLSGALQESPDLLEGRVLLAEVNLKLGDTAGAEKELLRARELGLSAPDFQYRMVKTLHRQAADERLLDGSQPLTEGLTNQQAAAILGMRAMAFTRMGKFYEAEALTKEALALDSEAEQAAVGAALLAVLTKDDGAEKALERAIAVAPVSADAWSLRGQFDFSRGELEEADAALSKAIELRGYPDLDLARRALLRTQVKKYAEAEQDLAALEVVGLGDHPFVSYVAGVNHFRQSRFQKAVDAFERSKNQSEPDATREYYLTAAYMRLGSFEQARQNAEIVRKLAPSSVEVVRLLGAIELNRSDFEAAEEVLREGVKDAPEDVPILKMSGHAALQMGDAAQAVKYYERALELEPGARNVASSLALARLMAGQDIGDFGEYTSGEADLDFRLLEALALFRDNQLGAAREAAEELLAEYPESVQVLSLLAVCQMRAAQWGEARKYLVTALSLEPGNASVGKNLAKMEMQLQDHAEAEKLLETVLERRPGDAEAAILLSELLAQQGRDDLGTEVLENAYQNNSDELGLRVALGRAYLRQNRPDRLPGLAADLSMKELATAPTLLELLGLAYMVEGDFESAQAYYQQWADSDSNSYRAHFAYAESLARSGKFERADRTLQRSLELGPSYLPARVGEIMMLARTGQLDKVKARMMKLRDEFGERREVLELEARIALRENNFSEAESRFASLMKSNPSNQTVIFYAQSLWGQEKFNEAIAVLQQWLDSHPRDLLVRMQLADAYMVSGMNSKARDTYEKILTQQPTTVLALNNLAWLKKDDDLDDAIGYAERALELAPGEAKVMDTLGILLLRGGDASRGAKLIEEAARTDPNDIGIQIHFAQVLVSQGRNNEARALLNLIVDKNGEGATAQLARSALEAIP